MNAAVEQCRLAAESGTKAIMPPQQAGVEGDPLPPSGTVAEAMRET
jgi:hypothetical protein